MGAVVIVFLPENKSRPGELGKNMKMIIGFLMGIFLFGIDLSPLGAQDLVFPFSIVLTQKIIERNGEVRLKIVDTGLLGKKSHMEYIEQYALKDPPQFAGVNLIVVWCSEEIGQPFPSIAWLPLNACGKFRSDPPFGGQITWDEMKRQLKAWRERGVDGKRDR